MKFEVVGTHNPQDFYNGTEPNDLVEVFITDEEDLIEIVKELLNVTGGSQGKGKFNISENRATKGYLQGLANGYMNARKDIAHLFKLHLDYTTKRENPTVNQQKALQKFADFLDWENKE